MTEAPASLLRKDVCADAVNDGVMTLPVYHGRKGGRSGYSQGGIHWPAETNGVTIVPSRIDTRSEP